MNERSGLRRASATCILILLMLVPAVPALSGPSHPPEARDAGGRESLPAGWTAVSGNWSASGSELWSSPVVRDLNNDSYPDLVVCNRFDGATHLTNSYVYWGSPTGYSTSSRTALPTMGAHGTAVCDLDLDGYQDIVFSNIQDDSTFNVNSYIYWGSASGYSTSDRTGLPTHGAVGVSAADLDLDGWPDLVFSNWYNGNTRKIDSYIYWGSASGFSTSDRLDLPTLGAVGNSVADLNNDGWPDIVFSNEFDDSSYNLNSYIYWGSATGFSTSSRTSLPTRGAYGNSVGDLDRDGWPDIVFSNENDASAFRINSYIYWGSASGYSTASRTDLPTAGACENNIADVDCDGWPDIVFSNYFDGSTSAVNTYIYLGSASGFSTSNRLELPATGSTGNLVGDLNSDGWPDIVVFNFYNSGSGSYIQNSFIYWGSAGGHSAGNRAVLSGAGSIAGAIASGSIPTAETCFGTQPAAPLSIALNTTAPGANYTIDAIIRFDANPAWLDVRAGAVFGFQDERNYFYAVLEAQSKRLEAFRVLGGRTVRVAASAGHAVNQNAIYNISMNVTGNNVAIRLNGTPVSTFNDANLVPGRCGPCSWSGKVRFTVRIIDRAAVRFLGMGYRPTTLSENETLNLNMTVLNPGTAAIPAVGVSLRKGDLFASSTPIASATRSLAPGERWDFSANWTAAGGRHTFWAALDGAAAASRVVTVNWAPVLDPVPDQTAKAGVPFELRLNASDREGDLLIWTEDSPLLDIDALDNRSAVISFLPVEADIGLHRVNITVTDSRGASATRMVNITVEPPNHPPVLAAIPDLLAMEGTELLYRANATDPDLARGDVLRFSDNSTLFDIGPSTGEIRFSPGPADVGVHPTSVTVTDLSGANDTRSFNITVRRLDRPPVAIQPGVQYLIVGVPFSLVVNATDPDLGVEPAERLSFSDDTAMFDIDPSTGAIRFTPQKRDFGTHYVNITVADAAGLSCTIQVLFIVGNINSDPVIAPVPDLTAVEDVPFSYTVSATDPDIEIGQDTLHFIDDSPLFDISGNGTISFTPSNDDVGVHAVTVVVRDDHNGVATCKFNLTVQNVNDPPSGVRIDFPVDGGRYAAGARLFLRGAGTDIDRGDVLTFRWFDNGNLIGTGAELEFRPAPGQHNISLEVSDGKVIVSRAVNVTIVKKTVTTEGFPWILAAAAAAVAVIAVVVAAAVIYGRKKAAGAPPEAWRGPPPAPIAPAPPPAAPAAQATTMTVVSKVSVDELEDERPPAIPPPAPAPEEPGPPAPPAPVPEPGEPARPRYTENDILKALTSLPRGLPSSLWGMEMEELAARASTGEYRTSDEGDLLVKIGNKWYFGNPADVGSYLQLYKGK